MIEAKENPYAEEAVEDLDELNEVLPVSFSITSYGADYPVDGLVKRISQGDILVPLFSLEPEEGQSTVGFQREFVWRKPQAARPPSPRHIPGQGIEWEAPCAGRPATLADVGELLQRCVPRQGIQPGKCPRAVEAKDI